MTVFKSPILLLGSGGGLAWDIFQDQEDIL